MVVLKHYQIGIGSQRERVMGRRRRDRVIILGAIGVSLKSGIPVQSGPKVSLEHGEGLV